VCRKAESPSMSSSMATVSTAQIDQAQKTMSQRSRPMPGSSIGSCRKKCHNTSDNSTTEDTQTNTHRHTRGSHITTPVTHSLIGCCRKKCHNTSDNSTTEDTQTHTHRHTRGSHITTTTTSHHLGNLALFYATVLRDLLTYLVTYSESTSIS